MRERRNEGRRRKGGEENRDTMTEIQTHTSEVVGPTILINLLLKVTLRRHAVVELEDVMRGRRIPLHNSSQSTQLTLR
jgi:hypothetical protein